MCSGIHPVNILQWVVKFICLIIRYIPYWTSMLELLWGKKLSFVLFRDRNGTYDPGKS
jgi:hypothetical protein